MANERIFISYKRVNKEPVFALINRIERELGVKCWVDLDGIETSAQFASKICTAIDRAEVVLFMHSSAHLNIDYDNDWTIRELNYAHSENKHVVLVKLDDAPLKNIFNLIYGTSNNIDSRNPDQWNILLRDLRKWLKLDGPKTQPTPPKPQPTPTTPITPLQELEEDLARVIGTNDKWGFKNKTGKVVIPCTWELAKPFSEGLALVKDSNGKWGFIDKTGKVVIPCTWEVAKAFSDNLAAVQDSNHKWGFIDRTGKIVIPCKWEIGTFSSGFSEGLAAVKDSNGKWGYIDKTGEVVIPCQWEYAYDFQLGKATVKSWGGLFGNKKVEKKIDKTGKVIG